MLSVSQTEQTSLGDAAAAAHLDGQYTVFNFITPAKPVGVHASAISITTPGQAVGRIDPIPSGSDWTCAASLTENQGTTVAEQFFNVEYITPPSTLNPTHVAGPMSGGTYVSVTLVDFPATHISADLQILVGAVQVPVLSIKAVQTTSMQVEFRTPVSLNSGPVSISLANKRKPEYGAADFTYVYKPDPAYPVSIEPSHGVSSGAYEAVLTIGNWEVTTDLSQVWNFCSALPQTNRMF